MEEGRFSVVGEWAVRKGLRKLDEIIQREEEGG